MRRKYFSETERKEANRRHARESYYRQRERRHGMRRMKRKGFIYAEEPREIPKTVLNEREQSWDGALTPGMIVLGDPLPGRSALDRERAGK